MTAEQALRGKLKRTERELEAWKLIAAGRNILILCYRTGSMAQSERAFKKMDEGTAILDELAAEEITDAH